MQAKPMQPFLILLITLIAIISAAALIPINRNYVFIDNQTEKIALHIPLKDPLFQIKYTHSIHLSEVLESYEVLKDNRLKMVELQYEDFNIGMPSNAGEGEKFVEKEGKYFIIGMDRELADFRIFVGDVDAGLSFISNGREYDLKKTLVRGQSYTFQVQRLTIIQQFRGVNIDEP